MPDGERKKIFNDQCSIFNAQLNIDHCVLSIEHYSSFYILCSLFYILKRLSHFKVESRCAVCRSGEIEAEINVFGFISHYTHTKATRCTHIT